MTTASAVPSSGPTYKDGVLIATRKIASVAIIHNRYLETSGENAVVELQRRALEQAGYDVNVYLTNSRDISDSRLTQLRVAASLAFGYHGQHWHRTLEQLIAAGQSNVAFVHNVYPQIGNDVFQFLKSRGVHTVQFMHAQRYSCLSGYRFLNGSICERCQRGNVIPGVFNKCYRESHVQSFVQAIEYARTRRISPYSEHVDRFVVLSQFARERLIYDGVPEAKITIIPNAIRAPQTNPRRVSEGRHILFIGRLAKIKGAHVAIEAVAGTGLPLVIAGDGPERSELERKAGTNVNFAGTVTGQMKAELFEAAKFVVVPSIWFETFPVSMLEAMSMGRPVIASRISGLPEILRDGIDGYLCTPGAVDEWRTSMTKLWHDNRLLTAMSAAAAERARSYSEEDYARHLDALINELIPVSQKSRFVLSTP